jgi:hypothetical protein
MVTIKTRMEVKTLGKGKDEPAGTVNSPIISTLENEPATITIGATIPQWTGATVPGNKSITNSITVLPTIAADGKISVTGSLTYESYRFFARDTKLSVTLEPGKPQKLEPIVLTPVSKKEKGKATLDLTMTATVQEAPADGLKFTVSLNKSEYVEGEPIIATATLTNLSDRPRRLAEPHNDWTLGLPVALDSGDGVLPPMIQYSTIGPPDGYGWEFGVGESRSCSSDLQAHYYKWLPPGTYSVRGVYSVYESIKGVWHGKISADKLVFTVVPATGDVAEAARLFREARAKVDSDKATVQQLIPVLKSLGDPAYGRLFAEYAGFFEAEAYRSAGDKSQYYTLMKAYVDTHGTVPYYGKLALTSLGWSYFSDGEYGSALRLFMKLPDGYE